VETWRGYRRAGPAARIGASEGHQSCCVLSESFARKDDRSTVTWIALEIMSIMCFKFTYKILNTMSATIRTGLYKVIYGMTPENVGRVWVQL